MRFVKVVGGAPLLGTPPARTLAFADEDLPSQVTWGGLQQAVLQRLGLPASLPVTWLQGGSPVLPEALASRPSSLVQDLAVVLGGAGGLLGGKGGFAAILKAEARQDRGGTRDFGMCRDLQGRRLKAVNDEIRLRKWLSDAEAEKRARLGKEYQEPAGPGGIRGWYLAVPSWAEVKPQKAAGGAAHGPRKTRVCADWQRAREGGRSAPSGAPPWWGCPRGTRCPFAHGEDDLRPEAKLAALQARAEAEKHAQQVALAAYTSGLFLYDADSASAGDMLATVRAGLAAAGEGSAGPASSAAGAAPQPLVVCDEPIVNAGHGPMVWSLSGAAAGADAAPDLEAEAGWAQGGDVSALQEAEGLAHLMARGTGFATVAVPACASASASPRAVMYEVTVGAGASHKEAGVATSAASSSTSKMMTAIPGYEDDSEEEGGAVSGDADAAATAWSGGVLQIGWVAAGGGFKVDPAAGEGVGDVSGSWAFDATRGVLLCEGKAVSSPSPAPALRPGDVVGALLVLGAGEAATAHALFYINGVCVCEPLPLVTGPSIPSSFFPALSLEGGEVVTLNTGVAEDDAGGCFAFPTPFVTLPSTGSSSSSSGGSTTVPVLPVAAAAAVPSSAQSSAVGQLRVTTHYLSPAARARLGLPEQPGAAAAAASSAVVPAEAVPEQRDEEAEAAVEPPAKRRKLEEASEEAASDAPVAAAAAAAAAAALPPLDLSSVASFDDIWEAGYRVEHLRHECSVRGLKAGGLWEELAHRLLAVKGLTASQVPKALQGKGFPGPAMPQ